MDMEAAMKRIPPHSAEAEQAVLGAMLMNKEAISMASEIITGEDFYQTAYGILFDCIVEMFQQGKPVDLITLQDYLKEKDVPPEIKQPDGGYVLSDQVHSVNVAGGEVADIGTITNDKRKVSIPVYKIDGVSNTALSGAKFGVFLTEEDARTRKSR